MFLDYFKKEISKKTLRTRLGLYKEHKLNGLQSWLSIKQTSFLPQASFAYFLRRLFKNQGLGQSNKHLLSSLQGAVGWLELSKVFLKTDFFYRTVTGQSTCSERAGRKCGFYT